MSIAPAPRAPAPHARRLRRARQALAGGAAVAAAALAVAGCGGGGGGPSTLGADPALAVPAGARLYISLDVRPGQPQSANAQAIASQITRLGNPFGQLVSKLDRSAAAGNTISYQNDISPWLGSRVGAFVTSLTFGGGLHVDGAIVASETNAADATAFLVKEDQACGYTTASSYRGVAFKTDGTGAAALVGNYVVVGSLAGVRAAIDATHGGATLAGESSYRQAIARLPSPFVATAYLDLPSLLSMISRPGSGGGVLLGLIAALLGGPAAALPPVVAELEVPSSHQALIDADTVGGPTAAPAPAAAPVTTTTGPAGGSVSATVAALPANAWLALGLGNLGSDLGRAVSYLQLAGKSGGSFLGLTASDLRFLARVVRKDLLPWSGESAFYLGGTSFSTLGGGFVVDSRDPALSRRAVDLLGAVLAHLVGSSVTAATVPGADAAASFSVTLSGVPLPIVIANGNGRFVVALGDQSASALLGNGPTFASSAIYQAAQSELGAGLRPGAVLDFPSLSQALDAIGLGSGGTIGKVLPYLETLGTLAIGGNAPDGRDHLRIALDVP